MCQLKSEGSFAMVNVAIQNQSLKFVWFNRLLSDSINYQFCGTYL